MVGSGRRGAGVSGGLNKGPHDFRVKGLAVPALFPLFFPLNLFSGARIHGSSIDIDIDIGMKMELGWSLEYLREHLLARKGGEGGFEGHEYPGCEIRVLVHVCTVHTLHTRSCQRGVDMDMHMDRNIRSPFLYFVHLFASQLSYLASQLFNFPSVSYVS